ncbi:hypothetical protein [Streptomyces sp. NPDC002994]|uniref:hypothetical protein n=1 Tax=Streptomyces sp. NPDC002994 TaxID=3154441 RepID=UPI0033B120B3
MAVISVLALGTIGAGVSFTVAEVSAADRTAPTREWASSGNPADDSAKSPKAPRKTGGKLAQRLLPVPDGYTPGPDIGEYGNDAELGERQAVALMQESAAALPRDLRKERLRSIDRMRVQGFAMRSYASDDSELVVEAQLVQMKPGAARDRIRGFTAMVDAFDVLRKGPKIKGHKNARCYVAPKPPAGESGGERLGAMFCLAYEDDLFISTTSYGKQPLYAESAAELLRKQLDLVASPGEYV